MNDPRPAPALPAPSPLPEVELLLAEPGRMVVRVNRLVGGRCTSALGQADTAEDAEDRARQRLAQRAPIAPAPAPAPTPAAPRPRAPQPDPDPQPDPTDPTDPAEPAAPIDPADPAEPDDWSDELQAADRELERLAWDRDRSGLYLERAFGHPSRDRLVLYADLVAWLQALRRLEPGADPLTAPLPLRRPQLLEQGEDHLRRLGWGAAEGRQLLEAEFGVSSRQQLNDADLLRFNQLLEQQLPPSPAGSGGG
ncbi:MAG: hypothetical protein ACKO2F_02205 [Cyanobacteriota bacterium]